MEDEGSSSLQNAVIFKVLSFLRPFKERRYIKTKTKTAEINIRLSPEIFREQIYCYVVVNRCR
jgi:hypothetical protein